MTAVVIVEAGAVMVLVLTIREIERTVVGVATHLELAGKVSISRMRLKDRRTV